ncbi:MAG: MFS transporter [Promethearchaeota archaeon]
MATENNFIKEKLPIKSKVAYAVANGSNGLLSGLGLGQIMYFYTAKLGMDANLQGIAWLIFAAWNAINDPLIGIFQERTKSKLGRRIPYLRYGSIIYAILFILVWFPIAPPSNQVGMFFNLLLMLFLFDTVYSMIGLVTYSLPAEMTITSKERGSIIMFSTIIGFVPQILVFALPIRFLQGSEANIRLWQLVMIIVAIACGFGLFIGSYFIKENKWAQREPTLGFVESIKECLKNKQFLILEITIFSLLIVTTILSSGLLFLMDNVIKMKSELDYLYFAPPVLVLLASLFILNSLISKLGIKKIFIIGTIIGAIGFALLPFFGRSLSTLFIPFNLVCVGFAAIILSQQPLMADVIDYDEVLTGKRRETTYSGVNALITKPAISIANWLFLTFLEKFGYKEGLPPEQQPETVATGVLLAFAIIPGICALISIIAMYFYKLDGPEWLKKKQEIQQVHIKKEKEYVEWLRRTGKI